MRGALRIRVLLLTFVVVALAHDAAAHTGGAVFEVREASAHGRTIRIELAVMYSFDRDPAEGAFLTAVPVAPDGRERAAIDMTRRPKGVYVLETEVDSLGRWTFQIASRLPPGSTVVRIDVTEMERPTPAPARPAPDGEGPEWLLLGAAGGASALCVVAFFIRRHRRRLA